MGLALITGTSTGIGLSTAIALARTGHKVAATMRNLKGAGEIERIAAAESLPIFVSQLDIDDNSSVANGVAAIVARHGPIDILVNNAGVPSGGSIEETPLAEFRSTMETNFFGGLRCIQAVVGSMRERRAGTIVNVTSIAGRLATPPMASYACSKWAFEALSEVLAQEMHAFNVRVAIIEPGVIATPIFTKGPPPIADTPYPHGRRLRAVFAASLAKPTLPSVVADQIVEIVNGDSWQLRYLVGADAVALFESRARKTDEQVVAEAGDSDEAFKARIKRDRGVDIDL